MSDKELLSIIELLSEKRPIFHSEADFQFALAWEIKQNIHATEIRLEYPPEKEPNQHIDILVRNEGGCYPIELKYKTNKLSHIIGTEKFCLKKQRGQVQARYDSVKDICRMESVSSHLEGFRCGYVLWLTNEPTYWKAPAKSDAGYADFSVHDDAKKAGVMSWGKDISEGTKKGREKSLSLLSEYKILWKKYSKLNGNSGLFKYSLLCVKKLPLS